eukprot:c17555_g1_i1 orf=371-580(-)
MAKTLMHVMIKGPSHSNLVLPSGLYNLACFYAMLHLIEKKLTLLLHGYLEHLHDHLISLHHSYFDPIPS